MNNNVIFKSQLEKNIYNAAFKGAIDSVSKIKKLRLARSSKSRNQVFGRLRNGARKNTLAYKKHRKIRSKMIELAIKNVYKFGKVEERLTYAGTKKKRIKKRNIKKRTRKRMRKK